MSGQVGSTESEVELWILRCFVPGLEQTESLLAISGPQALLPTRINVFAIVDFVVFE